MRPHQTALTGNRPAASDLKSRAGPAIHFAFDAKLACVEANAFAG